MWRFRHTSDMKHLRVTARIPPDYAPEFFDLLANDPEIEESRIVDWNRTPEGCDTVLFAIDGDATRFVDRAPSTPGVESVTLSGAKRRRTYALVENRPLSMPMFGAIHDAGTRLGLVVLKPLIYRDGTVSCRVVGEAGPLQDALDEAPEPIDVRVDSIGTVSDGLARPSSKLSERQREAVRTALALGYYDRPRGATHENVAAELGCAPATVSDHLQRAEAKLVRAVMDDFGPTV
ncbi:DNA-binding protein [Haloarcula sp. CBA1122]|nr:DNA-binding protein [Haloarcula sp. CBA1122]